MTPRLEHYTACPDCAESRRGRCAECRATDREDTFEDAMQARREVGDE